jgi:RimJ/RimL family protein N-acetyltransferase
MRPLIPPEAPLTDGVVTLRAFTFDDVPAVTAACQDPEISRWTATIPWPYEEEHARTWIASHAQLREQGEGAEWAVTAEDQGAFLGALGLRPFDWGRRSAVVGYWVASWARGTGVATRALRLGTTWALETIGLAAVELETMIGNVASERVAVKAGFRLVEEVSDYEHPIAKGKRFDVKRWGIGGGDGSLSPSAGYPQRSAGPAMGQS